MTHRKLVSVVESGSQVTHPERGLEFDLAVGCRLLQQEALVQHHVGDVDEAAQGQAQNAQLRLLLVLFDLPTQIPNAQVPPRPSNALERVQNGRFSTTAESSPTWTMSCCVLMSCTKKVKPSSQTGSLVENAT